MNRLREAILRTLAYADVFEYALTFNELHRFLIGVRASREELEQELERMDDVCRLGNMYALRKTSIFKTIRKRRNALKLLRDAKDALELVSSLKPVRMCALTGSVSALVARNKDDVDIMVIVDEGYVHRTKLVLSLIKRIKGYICPNFVLSTRRALEREIHPQNIYTAWELLKTKCIYGHDIYKAFLRKNAWIKEYFPNAELYEETYFMLKAEPFGKKLGKLMDAIPERLPYMYHRFSLRSHRDALVDEHEIRGFRSEYMHYTLNRYVRTLRCLGLDASL